MGIVQKIFGRTKLAQTFARFRELGGYRALFSPFGVEVYKSEIVRACIRPLAEHTAKASPKSSNRQIERILTYRPNVYMNGKDFLAKCRNLLEVKNTLFVFIQRDNAGHATGFYPVPYSSYEALEYEGELYVRFRFASTALRELTLPWADVAVMRRDYLMSDIGGEDNSAIIPTLDLIHTTNQGIANAVKSTANLRGIIKNTKAMLADDDTRKARDRFVQDYLNLENEGGVAVLDATQEFQPIKMEPAVTQWTQMREFRETVYRYFGVSDSVIQSKATEAEMEAFYSGRIEPFLIAFSLELTDKVFTEREKSWGAYIMFESSRLEFTSTTTKLNLLQAVDRGAMTRNEWRRAMNLAPIDGGDEPVIRGEYKLQPDDSTEKDSAEGGETELDGEDDTESPNGQRKERKAMQNTPLENMERLASAKGAEFRDFHSLRIEERDAESGKELIIEGVACVFNQPTVLFEAEGVEYKEMIDPGAFEKCDMRDVIFNYNHCGRVYARTRNKSLEVWTESDGLHMRARLLAEDSGHQELYRDIKSGLIDRMSFAFVVNKESYDKEQHQRNILAVKTLYDVSAVDIPAYDTTSIAARSFKEAESVKDIAESEKREAALKLAIAKYEYIGG